MHTRVPLGKVFTYILIVMYRVELARHHGKVRCKREMYAVAECY